MRTIFFLLFPIASFAQVVYTTQPGPLHDTLLFPTELLRRTVTEVHELPYKFQKVTDHQLMMGMDRVYLPRTNGTGAPNGAGTANDRGSRTRVLIYQPATNADIKPEELQMVEKLLLEIEKPGVYIPPVGPQQPVDDTTRIDGEAASFPTTWAHGPTVAAGWYKKTIAYGAIEGSTVTYKFIGTKIELWAEKKLSHGIGTIKIDQGAEKEVSFVGPLELPVKVYESEILPLGEHTLTLKVGKRVNNGYCLVDFFIVHNFQQVQGGVDPEPTPIPDGDVINVNPGDDVKKILQNASNKTIKFNKGTYTMDPAFIPVTVNVLCDGATITTNAAGYEGSGQKIGIFNLNSGSRTAGNQSITGCIFDGRNVAYSGVMVSGRDGVTLQNLVVRDTNFNGVWFTGCSNFKLLNSEFMNAAWADGRYLSGALNIANVSNGLIQNNKFLSNKNAKGTGIEALWKNTTLTNIKILNNKFDLSHHNPWNNGQSKNFAMELHDTYYRGLEIAYNEFQNEMSLASHLPGNGAKTLIHHNTGNLEGDTYFIEAICDDLEVYENNISGCAMFSANMQPNSRWKNHVYRNNTFVSSGKVDWGGIFLFGREGVQNIRIENNTINRAGNDLVRFMGTDKTGVQLIGVN